ncbi:YopX family protein [Bacillus thuringiensis]|uniref:YopX protein domain-containing protein n=1 Tax=Bacillus thuringiensis TaxID=1428 RepID=A0A9X6TJF1_BACTU|nr:YopX family protein [Bacillus thuringiensis]PEA87493.1 hypothetical protein CON71_24060 [Bacillus thuringiensis]
MGEIKVRAFDKVAEKMYDVGYIDFANEVVQVAMNKGGICYGTYVRRLKDVVLLQYTGLKDKEGNGIYEGDIVHMYSVMPGCDIDDIGIVKFIECAFLFEKADGSDGWSIFNEATEIEVVGNIYENPELLKN